MVLIYMRNIHPRRENVENILAICLPIVTMQHIGESLSASHAMRKNAWIVRNLGATPMVWMKSPSLSLSMFNPYAPLPFCSLDTLLPEGILEGTCTLPLTLKFNGHISLNNGPISKYQKWLTAEDFLYHPVVYWTHFGALGAQGSRRIWRSGSLWVKLFRGFQAVSLWKVSHIL